ncbi:hypothetical protein CEXT_51161 [Caerostris extrusa]|uniref:EGF-like domain-containing protein n=1 Tax=Caerostris extrusa TaxID=172846 RepID=A0AAV4RS29_CAEEX|nr:hypothetical protein CEXT_51161 [Caerostris extrusa]
MDFFLWGTFTGVLCVSPVRNDLVARIFYAAADIEKSLGSGLFLVRQSIVHLANCTFDVGFWITDKYCLCPDGTKLKDKECEDPCSRKPCQKDGTYPCSTKPCQNGGTCKIVRQSFKCDCKSPYSGTRCEIDPCSTNPCKNGGTCKVEQGTLKCYCKLPFNGTNCEIDHVQQNHVKMEELVKS